MIVFWPTSLYSRLSACLYVTNIVDGWGEKNPVDFGVEPTQSGQLAASLDLCYHGDAT